MMHGQKNFKICRMFFLWYKKMKFEIFTGAWCFIVVIKHKYLQERDAS